MVKYLELKSFKRINVILTDILESERSDNNKMIGSAMLVDLKGIKHLRLKTK